MNANPSEGRGGGRPPRPPKTNETRPGERVAKIMARAGLCSRRDAEAWIIAGRVVVNGETLTSPAFNVTDRDDVRVDGAPLQKHERTRLFLFHKPRGLVTTARDPEGRSTIFDALPEDAPRLVAIGRLDINTEGLILLTNDGGLARTLELPATGWLRRYRVRAHGAVDQAALDGLANGVTIDGVSYAGIEASLDREQGANVWMTMGLREGKNREIKRVLEHLGLAVNRLIRVSFGPFQLGDLEEGALAEVRTRVLREQIGARLAREAGADFDAPLREAAAEKRERPPRDGRSRPGAHHREAERISRSDEREAAPRRDERHPERGRKYIAALRAEREEAERGPRRRLERGETQDRRGRAVAVERFRPTRESERRDSEGTDRPRGKGGLRRAAPRSERGEAERGPSSRRGERGQNEKRGGRTDAAPRFRSRPENERRDSERMGRPRGRGGPRRDAPRAEREGAERSQPSRRSERGQTDNREGRTGAAPRFRSTRENERRDAERTDRPRGKGGPKRERFAQSPKGRDDRRPPRDHAGSSGGRDAPRRPPRGPKSR
jgi:23S rRNA pseudouridine2605 synthase